MYSLLAVKARHDEFLRKLPLEDFLDALLEEALQEDQRTYDAVHNSCEEENSASHGRSQEEHAARTERNPFEYCDVISETNAIVTGALVVHLATASINLADEEREME